MASPSMEELLDAIHSVDAKLAFDSAKHSAEIATLSAKYDEMYVMARLALANGSTALVGSGIQEPRTAMSEPRPVNQWVKELLTPTGWRDGTPSRGSMVGKDRPFVTQERVVEAATEEKKKPVAMVAAMVAVEKVEAMEAEAMEAEMAEMILVANTPRPARTPSFSVAAKLKAREEELKAARAELSLVKTPLTILSLAASASSRFIATNVNKLVTSWMALYALYPIAAVYLATTALMSESLWKAALAIAPSIALFTGACTAVGLKASDACTLPAVLEAGRSIAIVKSSMHHRMLPGEMFGDRQLIDEATLVDKYCTVLAVCGAKSAIGLGFEKADKYAPLHTAHGHAACPPYRPWPRGMPSLPPVATWHALHTARGHVARLPHHTVPWCLFAGTRRWSRWWRV